MTSELSPNTNWTAMARDAITLKPEPYVYMAEGRPSLRQAILLVMVVGLIIGGVQAIFGIVDVFRAPSFNSDEFISSIEQGISTFEQFGGVMDPAAEEVLSQIIAGVRAIAPSIERIMALPAPLPGVIGRFLTWLGTWFSSPFALLSTWLGISIWIMLFARLLGGRGALLPYLAASSLSVIPHLLSALALIPFIGWLLAFIGSIWGLAIQVKAVEVTHNLSTGRSILAVLLPYLIVLLLIMLGVFAFIITILSAIGAN